MVMKYNIYLNFFCCLNVVLLENTLFIYLSNVFNLIFNNTKIIIKNIVFNIIK